MPEVFHIDQDVAVVGEEWLARLKGAAASSPLRRARLCLHRSSDDLVQEMVIALCRDVLFRPHRHAAKSESFHIIEGELDVLIFDDEGRTVRAVPMGPPGSGRMFCYRLCVPAWHAVLPQTPQVIFHETTTGPFRAQESEFAPWAPTEAVALRRFLWASRDKALNRPVANAGC